MNSDMFGQFNFSDFSSTVDELEQQFSQFTSRDFNPNMRFTTSLTWSESDRQRLEAIIQNGLQLLNTVPSALTNSAYTMGEDSQGLPAVTGTSSSHQYDSHQHDSVVGTGPDGTPLLREVVYESPEVDAVDDLEGVVDGVDDPLPTEPPLENPEETPLVEPPVGEGDIPSDDTPIDDTPVDGTLYDPAAPIEMSAAEIKELLDDGHSYGFNFNGQEYTIVKNEDTGRYEAFDADGNMVDSQVQVEGDLTVEGFIEVGGLEGLAGGERLYIGMDDENNFTMLVGSAELDKNDEVGPAGSHRETLLQEGRKVSSGEETGVENNPEDSPVGGTPSDEDKGHDCGDHDTPSEGIPSSDGSPVDEETPAEESPSDDMAPIDDEPSPIDEAPTNEETPPVVEPQPQPPETIPPVAPSDASERVLVSDAVRGSNGSGAQGTRDLSLGGGNDPHQDISDAPGHQVLVVIDDAMAQEHINNAITALQEWTNVTPGLGFEVKLESELTSSERNTGGLFLEAVKSDDIDGNKGYASLGGEEGRFAHVRVAYDTSEDEFIETWSHEIGHGLALEHNLGTGEAPLAELSVMSDNDKDKSKDAPLPTVYDAAALQEFGYDLDVDPKHIEALNNL